MGELLTIDHRRTQEAFREGNLWDLTTQETTQRLKSVRLNSLTQPIQITDRSVQIWEQAQQMFDHPLVQVRGIIPVAEEDTLLDYAEELNGEVQEQNAEACVAGRIPFRINGEDLGIYYLQMASKNRPVYRNGNWLTHEEAVAQAAVKNQSRINRPLPPGFSVKVLEWSNGQSRDILTGYEEHHDMEEMAARLAAVHKLAFAYPHDPAQQTAAGVYDILKQNPVAIAFDPQHEVASVGYFERDERFTYGGINLVEPTYFTHPNKREHGLSSHLRMATERISRMTDTIHTWGRNPAIIFNESIRNSSFVLSQQFCELAGNANGRITGNLGDAYTAIGPANPDIGYMPMGLTYYPLHQSIRI